MHFEVEIWLTKRRIARLDLIIEIEAEIGLCKQKSQGPVWVIKIVC
jgi:hypothetical protein